MGRNEPERPTVDVRAAINDLLERNERTLGAVVGELNLGTDVLVARLARPVVIEGEAVTVEGRTVDVMELIAMHERGE